MEIILKGYVVKGTIKDKEVILGQNTRGESCLYYLDGSYHYSDGSFDNDKVSLKIYSDINCAKKAVDYIKRTWMVDEVFEILPVEVKYNIKEE